LTGEKKGGLFKTFERQAEHFYFLKGIYHGKYLKDKLYL
jgi:hypothetical protein